MDLNDQLVQLSDFTDEETQTQKMGEACPRHESEEESEWETGLWHLASASICSKHILKCALNSKMLHKYKGMFLVLTFSLCKLNFRELKRVLF